MAGAPSMLVQYIDDISTSKQLTTDLGRFKKEKHTWVVITKDKKMFLVQCIAKQKSSVFLFVAKTNIMSPSLFHVTEACLIHLVKNWRDIIEFFSVVGDTLAGEITGGYCYATVGALESYIFTLETNSVQGGTPFKQLRFYKRVEQVEQFDQITLDDEDMIDLRLALANDDGRMDDGMREQVDDREISSEQLARSGKKSSTSQASLKRKKNLKEPPVEFESDDDSESEEKEEEDDEEDEEEMGRKKRRNDKGKKKSKGKRRLQASVESQAAAGDDRTRRIPAKVSVAGRARSTYVKTLLFQMSSQAVLSLNDHMVRICHIFGLTAPPIIKPSTVQGGGRRSGGGGVQTRSRIRAGNFLTPEQLAE